jgi:hypothetical protein
MSTLCKSDVVHKSMRIDELFELRSDERLKGSNSIKCDGTRILVFKFDKYSFDVYDFDTLDHISTVDYALDKECGKILFVNQTSDNRYLTFAHVSGLVRFVDMNSYMTVAAVKVCEELTYVDGYLYIVRPDVPGRYVAAVRIDKYIYVVDTERMAKYADIVSVFSYFPVTFLDDSKFVYAAYNACSARVFDTESRRSYVVNSIRTDEDAWATEVDTDLGELYISSRNHVRKYVADPGWTNFRECARYLKSHNNLDCLFIKDDYCIIMRHTHKATVLDFLNRQNLDPVCSITLDGFITMVCCTPVAKYKYIVATLNRSGQLYLGKMDLDKVVKMVKNLYK